MKKMWKQYSYVILLFGLSICLMLAGWVLNKPIDEKYMEVVIAEGDTLWNIAEQYKEVHNLSTSEFIKWVEKTNAIYGEMILPGEKILIPVVETDRTETELASTM